MNVVATSEGTQLKARSKAQKLARRRGRPQKLGVPRTASGRLSRSFEARTAEERLAIETATWKRRQMNPELTPEDARKQEHGSVIARWLADYQAVQKRWPGTSHPNEFTRLHHDVAVAFQQAYEAYMSAIAAKRMRSGSDFGGVGGTEGDPFLVHNASRHQRAEERYRDARCAILESGSLGMMAVEAIVIENRPVESLRGDLRLALNRLAVLWKMQAG